MLLDQESKDAIKSAVSSAIDAVPLAPAQDDSGLQAQLDAANQKIADGAAALAAETAQDQADAQLAAQLQAKIAAAQAALS